MRYAPVFQPALNSSRSIPQSQACQDGLTFAAHYPADDYAASLASGAARLELWTNLPVSPSCAASTSRAAAWKAVALRPVQAKLGRKSGFSFAAKVQCPIEAVDGVYGFTYRIVHPDGQIDWLGSPFNDGQIHLPSSDSPCFTVRQLVLPEQGTDLEFRDQSLSLTEHDNGIALATLAASRRNAPGNLAFSIEAGSIQSGLVVERTKSTWCTSRRFESLTDVSPDFGASLLVLELAQSSSREVLVLLPVLDDASVSCRLLRGPCHDGKVHFSMVGANAASAKVSIALGTVDKLEQTIQACRSHAARTLRTPIHEPLGLGWSAKKGLDVDSPLSPSIDAIVPAIPYAYSETECIDVSFYSDSTAVDSGVAGLSAASSMVFSNEDQLHLGDDQEDASTVNGDRTLQPDNRSSPSKSRAGLGFCTWEAMQNEKRQPFLSEVVAALEAMEKRHGKGSITALLIDDGWQDVVNGSDDRGRLNSFEMNPKMLDLDEAIANDSSSSVLARYVSYVQQRFPSIRSVGCWMTLAGYWDGIHPDGPIATGLSAPLRRVRVEDPFRHASRDWFIQATELDMHLFWDRAFHSLRQSGIDFVKVDAQAEWEWIQGSAIDSQLGQRPAACTGSLGKAAFDAMEGAAARYFGAGGGVILSMAFTPALTNTSRTLHSQGMTIRCTDDFFPQIPDAHRHHLAHNVYNSLLVRKHCCDADMLSHCTDQGLSCADEDVRTDYTGYHASFRAFTEASLWLSDKADAPRHDSIQALVPPPAFSSEGTSMRVQARGRFLADTAFDDLIGDAVGPALKLCVQHEGSGSTTLGLWNLRGQQASTFDLLNVNQLLQASSPPALGSDSAQSHYAVRSFRSGKIWLLAVESGQTESESNLLSTTLETGSWEVLTLSPLLSTALQGVSVALLGSAEHFMTPEGVHSVTISTLDYVKRSRRRRSTSVGRRPSHQRRPSRRSISTSSSVSTTQSASENVEERALTTTKLDETVWESFSGSHVVLASLALINGFFAILHATVTGVIRAPRGAAASNGRKTKGKAGTDVVEAVIGMLDKLQTLFVFGLLVLASWTSALPSPLSKGAKKSSWLPFLGKREIQAGHKGDSDCMDGKTLKKVRLRPVDAVSTLRRCLASRTIDPLRECTISIAEPQPHSTASPEPPTPVTPTPEPSNPDVVVSALIDMAAKISFLVLCPGTGSIKACTIDRTMYDCASTPWIQLEPIALGDGSAQVCNSDSCAIRVEVDMKAWVETQDETYVQSLSAPVSLSLRISAS